MIGQRPRREAPVDEAEEATPGDQARMDAGCALPELRQRLSSLCHETLDDLLDGRGLIALRDALPGSFVHQRFDLVLHHSGQRRETSDGC